MGPSTGRTFAEKVVARHAGHDAVSPGQMVGVTVDLVTCDELSFPQVAAMIRTLGVERVFDGDRVAVVADHETPARDLVSAEHMKATRVFASEFEIGHLLDAGEAGIVHVVVPERGLVSPGEIMAGYDSHVLTAGALGAFAVGIGATDTAVAMAFGELWLRVPESVRIVVDGEPRPWTTPKDVGLQIVARLGQAGCLYQAIEYDGAYPASLAMDGRFTLVNMSIEIGAKSAAIEPDAIALDYLQGRGARISEPVWADAGASYAATHVFDVEGLAPMIALPSAPDSGVPVSEVAGKHVDQVFLGTCTNGRLTDLRVAAAVLRGRRVHPGTRLVIIPGSPEVFRLALAEGLVQIFADAGAVIGPPGCGPCAGLHMGVLAGGEVGLSTSSRNFPGRMGSPESLLYLAGPAVAAATAVAGEIAGPEEVVGTRPPKEIAVSVRGRVE